MPTHTTTTLPMVMSIHPQGPSSEWRPKRDSCVPKVSCPYDHPWPLNGRLGNRLMKLSATLEQAVSQNLCWALLRPADAAYIRMILDIPADGIIDMAEPQGVDRAKLPATGQN